MSRKLSEEECYVCDVCDGSWQGVNEQNGEFKCYHCSEAQKHLYAVKIMKAELDSCVTEIAKLKELNGRAAGAIEYIEKIVQLGNKNFELTRMEREFITELREAAK